jgi:PAS domain S-box-containing protein
VVASLAFVRRLSGVWHRRSPDAARPPGEQGEERGRAISRVNSSVPLGWLIAILAYVAIVNGGIVSDAVAVWINNFAWTVAPTIAALATWRASRRLQGKRQVAWTLFAFGCLSWLAGQLVWDWNELVRGVRVPFPSVGDYGYIGFALLMIAGLYSLSATQTARRLTPQRAANLGLIVCSLGVVLVATTFEPVMKTDRPAYYVALTIAEGVIAAFAFVIAMYFIWSYRWRHDLLPLTLVTAGLALHAASALIYSNQLMLGRFAAASLLNGVWVVAFALQHWAAVEQGQAETRRATGAPPAWEGSGWIEALVPSFLLLFIAATRIAFVEHISPTTTILNWLLLAVFAILLAFRECWLYSHGQNLQARLQRAQGDLDNSREQLRMLAEQRLELERATRFAALAGGVGLWDWNLRTQRVEYSPQWKRQLGYEEFEISDGLEEWRSRIHPDDVEVVMGALESYVRRPTGEYKAEMRVRHRDGSYRWILARATAYLDRQGTPLRIVGAQVDITDRKRVELALQQSELRHRELAGKLEQRVAERTSDLELAYREAQSFAYAVAHDLKAPLRAIDSFGHLLEESARGLTDTEKGYLARVRRGAIHMSHLIEGLLAYSRIEHRELSLARVALHHFVSEMIGQRQDEIAAKGVSVNVDIEPGLRVLADRAGLAVIVLNLLDNALKFTSMTEQPRIDIGARSGAGTVTLWMRDNGIGFDPVYHDKIFEIFQRLHRGDQYTGTGIGLALARKAAHRMHGRIWAQSQLGAGATFYVELPLADSQPIGR